MNEDSIKWGMKIAYDIIDNYISRNEQQGENTDGKNT